MDCLTQADASSIPATNVAGVFCATAWYRVLFHAFASSGTAFSPRRLREFRAVELLECCRTER